MAASVAATVCLIVGMAAYFATGWEGSFNRNSSNNSNAAACDGESIDVVTAPPPPKAALGVGTEVGTEAVKDDWDDFDFLFSAQPSASPARVGVGVHHPSRWR